MKSRGRPRSQSLNCREYIDEYLAAHADGELSMRERRAADEHVGGCSRCRAQLADERALKALIRQHSVAAKAPADLRLQIRAALAEMGNFRDGGRESAKTRAANAWSGHDGRREGKREGILGLAWRRGAWVAGAAAAVLVLSLALANYRTANVSGIATTQDVPDFDHAIAQFNKFATYFSPNVPAEAFNPAGNDAVYAWVESPGRIHDVSDEAGDIERSYEQANLPGDLLNLDSSGYRLYGARIERTSDGRPIGYTLYRDGDAAILSMSLEATNMDLPNEARFWLGMHSFYQYKGYALCVTTYPTGHDVSIVVTPAPVKELIRTIALADIASTNQ